MVKHSNNLILKSTDEDSGLIESFLKNEDVGQFLSERNLYPGDTVTTLSFVIYYGSECIGFAKMSNIRWYSRKAELTIYLGEKHRNKGYGRQIMKELLDMAFNKFHFHRLEGELYEYNLASKSLVEYFGFKLEGRLREARYYNGKYYDILRFGLLDREFRDS